MSKISHSPNPHKPVQDPARVAAVARRTAEIARDMLKLPPGAPIPNRAVRNDIGNFARPDIERALDVVGQSYRMLMAAANLETAKPWPTQSETPIQQCRALRAQWDGSEAAILAARMPRNRRRALLVDDASDILVIVGAFLEDAGFEVLRAASGDTALRLIAEHGAVDLLVTDHVMPGMTGKDLAVQALALHASLRVLIITGYAEADELTDLPAGIALLNKPFRKRELTQCIDSMFNAVQPVGAAA